MDNFDLADADFVTAGRAFFRADFAGDDDAGFLCQAFQRFECFGILFQRTDALDDAGAVAEDREEQFAGFAQVIEPAFERNFLAVIPADLLDGDGGHLARFIRDVHFAEAHAFSKRSMDLRAAVSCSEALGASGPVFSFNSSSRGRLRSGADLRSLMAAGQSMEPS